MAEQKKIQLYTDRACTVEASPETMAKNVTLSDGLDVESVLKHDLTAPTVVHEETSFKIGVGDIDVSSSVVDGEPSKVVIKGKTYQNILPEPSLRNSMTNGKSMQKLNEGYENVNVVDGVAKSAILYGSTLVNINSDMNQINEKTNITPFDVLEERIIKCVTNGKKYLISGEVSKCTLRLFFDGVEQPAETRLTENRKYVIFSFIGNELNIRAQKDAEQGNCYYNNIKIIEYQDGMENWDIPYFEGMQSVRMPVLTTVGKNLLPPTKHKWYPFFAKKGTTFTLSTKDGVESLGGNVTFKDINGNDLWFSIEAGQTKVTKTINRDVYSICNATNGTIEYQLEQNSTATPYEPYKSNILSTSEEVVLRSLPNGVCDTLNITTGEYVQRIGKVTFDGSNDEVWNSSPIATETVGRFVITVDSMRIESDVAEYKHLICDKHEVVSFTKMYNQGTNGVSTWNLGKTISIRNGITDLALFKADLQQNPVTIQYELAEPIVKTVDLSSYGNWEKIVLDGSQNLNKYDGTSVYYGVTIPSIVPFLQGGNAFANKLLKTSYNMSIGASTYSIAPANSLNVLCFSLDGKMSKEQASQYLSENPITVWYKTISQQENSIKEMLSFKDGHIQLSSEAGSLIPSLDYEVPTSNSYHMDLLKNNVIYTMKCENPNGKLLVKDADIALRENRTIQIGLQYMPDDNLFINTGSWTNPMIIEGDLTSKTLPYFKGIKSSFENEDKIEVLSTGKNLLDKDNIVVGGSNFWESNRYDIKRDALNRMTLETLIDVNTQRVVVSLDSNYYVAIQQYDENECRAITSDSGWRQNEWSVLLDTKTKKINIIVKNMTDSNITNDDIKTIKNSLQIEYGGNKTTYDSYKSNVSKIPLLSPLRSLPNGVCDELIIDRMKKKATLIQRVGMCKFDSKDKYNCRLYIDGDWATNNSTGFIYRDYTPKGIDHVENKNGYHICSDLATSIRADIHSKTNICILGDGQYMGLKISNDKVGYKGTLANDYLSKNPITVYYELATPVVTEIDLEGFPLVYKDGHIFLNSEIAPVVEIDYNVNQSQQIQANNETLQRHELDILDLDNLIVSFVNAEYNLRLLKFDMELSMMALAE